ncbi:hypothetical protein ASG40_04200 [Methylobacterium sp. Leaf399]|nr:hypothetical protein ASG40_04200 [Methylobacterium sp. Leaf399]
MNLDGAENAKAEVFKRAFRYAEVATAATDGGGPIFAPAPDTAAHADIARARRAGEIDPKEKIAVGILRRDRGDDRGQGLKLGLFVQHKKLLHHPVVEAALRVAPTEAEVIVTGRIRSQGRRKVRTCRPLRMGESVGHHRITAGTIGCFGVDADGRVGLISNNHVLAMNNKARVGDIILQPGRADGGDARQAAHVVAKLGTYVPLDFDPTSFNLVDCAFAPLEDGHARPEPFLVGDGEIGSDGWSIGDIEDVLIDGDPVKKVGRTTRFSTGVVDAIAIDNVRVQMVSGAAPRFAIFNRQIAISGTEKTFSKGGDSGSLICTMDGRPIALLFAGTETGGRNDRGITFANPIRAVLDALAVDLYSPATGV